MKTTVEISDSLLTEVKKLARREDTTVRALIEAGLRAVLRERCDRSEFRLRDVSFRGKGLQPAFQVIDPVQSWVERYEAHYREVYQPAYAALRPLHHAADAIERAAAPS